MKLSLFKVGVILMLVGGIWISLIFAEAEKGMENIFLGKLESFEIKSGFTGTDIGYYKIFIPEFSGEKIFVQILDAKRNVIQEGQVQTKMSVGYFDFNENGPYSVKVTNLSKNPTILDLEFGNTDSQKMIPGGVLVFLGAIITITMAYMRIRDYKIAQPEENIS